MNTLVAAVPVAAAAAAVGTQCSAVMSQSINAHANRGPWHITQLATKCKAETTAAVQ